MYKAKFENWYERDVDIKGASKTADCDQKVDWGNNYKYTQKSVLKMSGKTTQYNYFFLSLSLLGVTCLKPVLPDCFSFFQMFISFTFFS